MWLFIVSSARVSLVTGSFSSAMRISGRTTSLKTSQEIAGSPPGGHLPRPADPNPHRADLRKLAELDPALALPHNALGSRPGRTRTALAAGGTMRENMRLSQIGQAAPREPAS
jgi:hypothetical protein